jgi:Fic family protein
MPAFMRAGLAHVQFEPIHPFLDGNGRVGRLLITLLLCEAGILKQPLLYLSLHFKQHRDEYYRLLDRVRMEGVWEEWLEFYFEGVKHTADSAVSTAQRLEALFAADRDRASEVGRRAGSALRVHDVLKAKAVTSLPEVKEKTGLSFPAASNGMDVLVDLGIARELTGKRRNRVFVYSEYVTILNEGAED